MSGVLQAHGLGKEEAPMIKRSLISNIIYEGRITKFFPVVAAVFAVDAVLRSQGQKTSYIGAAVHQIGHEAGVVESEPDWSETREFDDEAHLVDPFVGHEWATIEDPTWYERLATGTVASAALVNPMAWGRNVGAATKVGTRGAATGAGKLTSRIAPKTSAKLTGRGQLVRPQGMKDEVWDAMSPAARRGFSLSSSGGVIQPGTFADDAFRGAGALPVGRRWGRAMTGRGIQAAGSAGVPELITGAAAAWAAPHLDYQPDTSGFHHQSPNQSGHFSGANVGSSGGESALASQVHGVTDQSSIGPGDKSLWQHAAGESEYWHKGENMKIGDRMLKELTEMMYKAATCPCGKTPCICKEYKNKKDDKKKPAHGMVIIIGSKAGPGPSTDGKRDKLDSEKDEKDE
jgi:hypothetical protein